VGGDGEGGLTALGEAVRYYFDGSAATNGKLIEARVVLSRSNEPEGRAAKGRAGVELEVPPGGDLRDGLHCRHKKPLNLPIDG
jgi:hypothetical protein